MDNFCTLAMACAQAVCTSVSAANDQYPLTRRKDLCRRIDSITLVAMVLLGQKFHRIMDAFKFASRNLQIARLLSASSQQHGFILTHQLINRHIYTHMCVGDELHTLRAHLFNAAIDHMLFKLEIWNAVTQQTADAIVLFVHRY